MLLIINVVCMVFIFGSINNYLYLCVNKTGQEIGANLFLQ